MWNLKNFPLMALPTDIRLNILEYILPHSKDGSKSITFEICQYRLYASTAKHSFKISPSRDALNRYLKGIGRVNHQLHAECMRLLYSRPFILDFQNTNIVFRDVHGYPEMLDLERPRYWRWGRSHPGDRGDFFPGLDFGRIKELRILARPNGSVNYWFCLLGSVRGLCEALSPRIAVQGLKRLKIVVGEDEAKNSYTLQGELIEPKITQREDVMELLETACYYLRDVGSCLAVMPYRLMHSDDQREEVTGMLDEICSPWTEGDWIAQEKTPSYNDYSWYECMRTSNAPIPPSELTTEDIENDKFFKGSWESVSPTGSGFLKLHFHCLASMALRGLRSRKPTLKSINQLRLFKRQTIEIFTQ